MMEDLCHDLDIKLGAIAALTNKTMDQGDSDKYISVRRQVRELEHNAEHYNNRISMIHEAISSAIIQDSTKDKEIKELYNTRSE